LTGADCADRLTRPLCWVSAKSGLYESGDKLAMLAVLFGQGEVLVIVIITAITVYFILRRKRR